MAILEDFHPDHPEEVNKKSTNEMKVKLESQLKKKKYTKKYCKTSIRKDNTLKTKLSHAKEDGDS